MKAITLTQPWATLVAIGAKKIETRSWETHFLGPIAIHAAKAFPADARALCPTSPFAESLGTETLHTAQIIAVATLVKCFRFSASSEALVRRRSECGMLPPFEAEYGDYTPGRYGFVFENVRRLETPIACRGMLGLWNMPTLAERELIAQIREAA